MFPKSSLRGERCHLPLFLTAKNKQGKIKKQGQNAMNWCRFFTALGIGTRYEGSETWQCNVKGRKVTTPRAFHVCLGCSNWAKGFKLNESEKPSSVLSTACLCYCCLLLTSLGWLCRLILFMLHQLNIQVVLEGLAGEGSFVKSNGTLWVSSWSIWALTGLWVLLVAGPWAEATLLLPGAPDAVPHLPPQ